jgi:hypothetical protein
MTHEEFRVELIEKLADEFKEVGLRHSNGNPRAILLPDDRRLIAAIVLSTIGRSGLALVEPKD